MRCRHHGGHGWGHRWHVHLAIVEEVVRMGGWSSPAGVAAAPPSWSGRRWGVSWGRVPGIGYEVDPGGIVVCLESADKGIFCHIWWRQVVIGWSDSTDDDVVLKEITWKISLNKKWAIGLFYFYSWAFLLCSFKLLKEVATFALSSKNNRCTTKCSLFEYTSWTSKQGCLCC